MPDFAELADFADELAEPVAEPEPAPQPVAAETPQLPAAQEPAPLAAQTFAPAAAKAPEPPPPLAAWSFHASPKRPKSFMELAKERGWAGQEVSAKPPAEKAAVPAPSAEQQTSIEPDLLPEPLALASHDVLVAAVEPAPPQSTATLVEEPAVMETLHPDPEAFHAEPEHPEQGALVEEPAAMEPLYSEPAALDAEPEHVEQAAAFEEPAMTETPHPEPAAPAAEPEQPGTQALPAEATVDEQVKAFEPAVLPVLPSNGRPLFQPALVTHSTWEHVPQIRSATTRWPAPVIPPARPVPAAAAVAAPPAESLPATPSAVAGESGTQATVRNGKWPTLSEQVAEQGLQDAETVQSEAPPASASADAREVSLLREVTTEPQGPHLSRRWGLLSRYQMVDGNDVRTLGENG
jgi:hypothetical protein